MKKAYVFLLLAGCFIAGFSQSTIKHLAATQNKLAQTSSVRVHSANTTVQTGAKLNNGTVNKQGIDVNSIAQQKSSKTAPVTASANRPQLVQGQRVTQSAKSTTSTGPGNLTAEQAKRGQQSVALAAARKNNMGHVQTGAKVTAASNNTTIQKK